MVAAEIAAVVVENFVVGNSVAVSAGSSAVEDVAENSVEDAAETAVGASAGNCSA